MKKSILFITILTVVIFFISITKIKANNMNEKLLDKVCVDKTISKSDYKIGEDIKIKYKITLKDIDYNDITKDLSNKKGCYKETWGKKKIKSDLIVSNIIFEETFPKGLNVELVPKEMNINNNKVKGNLSNITYHYDKKEKKYKANAVEFYITLKGNKKGNYILGEKEDSFINYNMLFNNLYMNSQKKVFKAIKLSIQDKAMTTMGIKKSLDKEKIKVKKDEFTMTYTINPEVIKANPQKKDLDIVLVIDKSESMKMSLNKKDEDNNYKEDSNGRYRMIYRGQEMYYGILNYHKDETEPYEIVVYTNGRRIYCPLEKYGDTYKILGDFNGFFMDSTRKFSSNTRLEAVQDAANRFIDSFKNYDGNVSIGAVSYEAFANMEIPLKDKKDFENLKTDINHIIPEGGTNIGDGLRNAYWMLKDSPNKNRERYIVLLTDGDPCYYTGKNGEYVYDKGKANTNDIQSDNYSKNGLDYAEKLSKLIASDKDSNIKSYMIAFTSDIHSENLKAISDAANDGERCFYKEAQTKENIDNVYKEISNSIKRDLYAKNMTIEEDIPEGIEITELPPGFKVKNGKLIGNIGDIHYILDEKSGEYKAKPLEFKIKAKGTKSGEYILGKDKSSKISYKDVTGENIDQYFNENNIQIDSIDSSLIAYGVYTNKTIINPSKEKIQAMKEHLNISEDGSLKIPKDIKTRVGFLIKVNNKDSNFKINFDNNKVKIHNYDLYDADGEVKDNTHKIYKIDNLYSTNMPFNKTGVKEEKYYFVIFDMEGEQVLQDDLKLIIDNKETKIKMEVVDIPDLF
ncbi:VWA domain-containing protein [Clostridium niameyense]|uniref:VWA domain-containing protein n=1 Tax=Clostridium niameyense TaxID=1622073 RepID=A0A6M0R8H6_9CLOT|nr:vWA domain-containing protein [Clostridium niameyense]NEZ46553.1 VWA domain-containing protein [Clostridium niameyense]